MKKDTALSRYKEARRTYKTTAQKLEQFSYKRRSLDDKNYARMHAKQEQNLHNYLEAFMALQLADYMELIEYHYKSKFQYFDWSEKFCLEVYNKLPPALSDCIARSGTLHSICGKVAVALLTIKLGKAIERTSSNKAVTIACVRKWIQHFQDKYSLNDSFIAEMNDLTEQVSSAI